MYATEDLLIDALSADRAAVAAAQATQLGINMGELQTITDAHGGSLPSHLTKRTPSPSAVVSPLNGRHQESARALTNTSNKRSDLARPASPMGPPVARQIEEDALAYDHMNIARPIPAPVPVQFAPFPAVLNSNLLSLGHYDRRAVSPAGLGHMFTSENLSGGVSREYESDGDIMDQYTSANVIERDHSLVHRRSNPSSYEQPRQQQQQPIMSSQSQSQRYEPFGDFSQTQSLQASQYNSAYQPQPSQFPNFGSSSNALGYNQDDLAAYGLYDESNPDDFTVRIRQARGMNSSNMNRIASYRRDYGHMLPDWQARPDHS